MTGEVRGQPQELVVAWPGLNGQFGCSSRARLKDYFWPAQARLQLIYKQPNKLKLSLESHVQD